MKKLNIFLTAFALLTGFSSCENELDVVNTNNQTTYEFGNNISDLQEAVIACYNRIRLEGTFARVGYTMDAVRGDEVWNSSQQWYLEYDNLNSPGTIDIGDQWIWRDWYHVINRANFILSKVDKVSMPEKTYNQIAGQAYFLRGLAYYYLATYYQTVPLITDYSDYIDMNSLYAANVTQDEVLDQVESDLGKAMTMLPSRDEGGEWAKGRATSGSAAGYMARALMFRHKFADAYEILKDIIAGEYGHYDLMPDYGANFMEGPENENIIGQTLWKALKTKTISKAFLKFSSWTLEQEEPIRNGPLLTSAHSLLRAMQLKVIMHPRNMEVGETLQVLHGCTIYTRRKELQTTDLIPDFTGHLLPMNQNMTAIQVLLLQHILMETPERMLSTRLL